MDHPPVILFDEPEPGIGVVTLNRPERLNAILPELIEALHARLDAIEREPRLRVVILTGAGRGFCAGYDLKAAGQKHESPPSISKASVDQRRLADLVLRLRQIPQPVIAAVNGVAAGGGFSLTMAADIRVAAETARFVAAYINIGLSAGEMGSSYFLPRLIGFSRAAEILCTGRMVEAAEAERIGFVSRVVPEGKSLEAAMELARTMLAKSPFGLRMTKEVLNQSLDAPSLESALYMENRTQILATRTEDFRESVRAFAEKRPPRYA